MLIWLDNSILNVAMATMADPVAGLGAGSGDLAWIAGSYSLVFAGTLFAGGALADRFGPRTTLVAGLVVFAAASAAGAYAATPAHLIIARGLMGAGSGLLMPATLSIIVQCTAPAQRTRAIAIWGSASGLGVAIGPAAGGALLSHFWWGSVFLVNIPIVAGCLAGIAAAVPAVPAGGRRRLDLPGLLLSVLGFGGVVYGVIELGRQAPWTSPRVLVPILAGLGLVAAFLVGQLRSTAPSFDPRLFTRRRFAAGNIVLLLAFMALSGQLFFAAFYLQGPRGLTPSAAGGVMVAAAAGIVLGSLSAPTAVRLTSARWTTAGGVLASGVTYAAYPWFDQRTPLAVIVVMLFVQGFGMGILGTPVTVAMMADVPTRLTGAGSAVGSATRQLGSALGVAVAGSVLAAVYRRELAPVLPSVSEEMRERALTSVEAARSVGVPALSEAADRAFLTAMSAAAVVTALLAAAGFAAAVAGLSARERPPSRAERRSTPAG
ncbi:MFS transporter [Actinoplanes sp. NEAU-A12]|uniref:MFS transporter n=2 Tax=Actinoplanes sandaracinus TaxID=3045177 RepID=A0ABT6WYA8_9ACTN|nr:MFS transporter [Actinoplanes sandaracinus]